MGSMKTIQLIKFTTPADAVACVDVADPAPPQPGHVVARIEAFPINPADLYLCEGAYATRPPLPATLGAEGVGLIEAVGDGVTNVAAGDRVMFRDRDNWTEKKSTAAENVVKLPDRFQGAISQDLILQAAMLKVNPATALLMMRDFVKPEPGDWLLQNAGNSAVGVLINRLAAAEGWRVANIVRSEAAAQKVRDANDDAAVVLDGGDLAARVAAATGDGRVRLGIDALAGDHCMRMADSLSEAATLVCTYGRLSGEPCRIEANNLIFRGLVATGFWLGPALAKRPLTEVADIYKQLANAIADGDLTTDIEATYPITDIRAAVTHAKQGGRSGKILVVP